MARLLWLCHKLAGRGKLFDCHDMTFKTAPAAVRRAIERPGAELRFLVAYSPDFNSLEMAFAKLKALPQEACPRTVGTLCDTIVPGIDASTPAELRDHFAAAGYDRE